MGVTQEQMGIVVTYNGVQAEKGLDKTQRKLESVKRAGYSSALSLMFAGMAVARISQNLMNFGVKAYNEISHSVIGTITATDRLNGAMQFLGFSIGEALQPLFEALIPIIEAISDWVNLHPVLTRNILVTMVVVGTLVTVLGSLALVLSSIGKLWALATLAGNTAWITSLIAGLDAAVVSLGAFFAAAGPILAMAAAFAIVALWIYKMGDAMGGVGEFFKSVVRGILRVLVLLGQGILDMALAPINIVIMALNGLINLYNSFAKVASSIGINLPQMKTLSTVSADIMTPYLNWEQNSALAPSKGYSNSASLIPTYNTQNNPVVINGDINVSGVSDVASILAEVKKYANNTTTTSAMTSR